MGPGMNAGGVNLSPPLRAHVVFVRYVLFAVIAGFANLATQEIVFRTAPIAALMTSLVTGTGVGFFVKYVLDKRWIFLDGSEGGTAEIRKIVVYGVFGVLTTLLFWAIELGAWHIWSTASAKYVGAAIGLSLGNYIKYLLDKRFVFTKGRR